MSRPRSPRTPDPDPALFPAPAVQAGRPRKGRHERQADTSITAGRAAGILTERHAALVSMVRGLARALDLAERTDQPYAVAQVSRELRAALTDARLVPDAAPPADPFDALMADLSDDAPASA